MLNKIYVFLSTECKSMKFFSYFHKLDFNNVILKWGYAIIYRSEI